MTLRKSHHWTFRTGGWQPAINAYRNGKGFRICVDLAGVDPSLVKISIEPRRVVFRGQREAPELLEHETRTVRVLAMEIDHGPFERMINLDAEVDPDRASTEQRNGLLWLFIPFRPHS